MTFSVYMNCQGYGIIRHELLSLVSQGGQAYYNDKLKVIGTTTTCMIKYILEEYNEVTSKIKGKYNHLKFQKRKENLIQNVNA